MDEKSSTGPEAPKNAETVTDGTQESLMKDESEKRSEPPLKRSNSVTFSPGTKPPADPAPAAETKKNVTGNYHSRRNVVKTGKANLARDVPIFLGIFAFLMYIAWVTQDVGVAKKGKRPSLKDIKKNLENVAKEFEREQQGRKRMTKCGLFLAPSTIPSAGLSWYAGRNYSVGDALLVEPGSGEAFLSISHTELLLKHHPILANIERGEKSSYRASRHIQQSEELFLAYEHHPHSRIGEDHHLFRQIPTEKDYDLAAQIVEIEATTYALGEKSNSLVQGHKIPNRGKRDLSASGDRALKMVSKAISLMNQRVSNLLPESKRDLAQNHENARPFALEAVKNRTIYWLEVNGMCMDDVVVKDGSVYAQRPIKSGKLVMVAPLYVQRRARQQGECALDATAGKGACFGHSESCLLLCPFTMAASMKYSSDAESANALYRWGGWNKLNQNAKYQSAEYLLTHAQTGLSLDIIAARDIAVGDEIVLDISGHTVSGYGVEMDSAKFPKGWKQWA